MKQFIITSGEGRYELNACISLSYGGISVYICGGDTPHIGSAVLAHPRLSNTGKAMSCTSSVLNLSGHKDEVYAREMAEKLCMVFKLTICVCAGVHLNNASQDDIACMNRIFFELLNKAIREIPIYFNL